MCVRTWTAGKDSDHFAHSHNLISAVRDMDVRWLRASSCSLSRLIYTHCIVQIHEWIISHFFCCCFLWYMHETSYADFVCVCACVCVCVSFFFFFLFCFVVVVGVFCWVFCCCFFFVFFFVFFFCFFWCGKGGWGGGGRRFKFCFTCDSIK